MASRQRSSTDGGQQGRDAAGSAGWPSAARPLRTWPQRRGQLAALHRLRGRTGRAPRRVPSSVAAVGRLGASAASWTRRWAVTRGVSVGSTGTRKSIIVSTSSSQAAWASSRARTASVVTATSAMPGRRGGRPTAVAVGTVAACRRRRSRTRRSAGTSSNAISRAISAGDQQAGRAEVPAPPVVAAERRRRRRRRPGPARVVPAPAADAPAPGGGAADADGGRRRAGRCPAPSPSGPEPATPAAGVASNGIQPKPLEVDLGPGVRVAVGHHVRVAVALLPRVKPNATRAGMPASRTIHAIAAAYCWQYPILFCRKSAMSGPAVPAGWVCRLYVKPLSSEK